MSEKLCPLFDVNTTGPNFDCIQLPHLKNSIVVEQNDSSMVETKIVSEEHMQKKKEKEEEDEEKKKNQKRSDCYFGSCKEEEQENDKTNTLPNINDERSDWDKMMLLSSQKRDKNIYNNTGRALDDFFSRLQRRKSFSLTRDHFSRPRGSPLHSCYIVKQTLGKGTWGTVHLAIERSSGISRAIKKIPKRYLELHRFRQEIQLLKTLDHPNIIRLYETFEDHANLFMVMELCSGGELFDLLRLTGRLNERRAANLMKQVFSAVQYYQSKRVAHRDLKPENFLFVSKPQEYCECKNKTIMTGHGHNAAAANKSSKTFSPKNNNDDSQQHQTQTQTQLSINDCYNCNNIHDETIKLIDFGLAKRFTKTRKLRTKVGTLYYISPQVFEGSYDSSCDLWSCGVLLYLLLSGSPPFNGPNDSVIMENICKAEISFKENIWKDISISAKDLIIKLLTVDPNKRITASQALSHSWFAQMGFKSVSNKLQGLSAVIYNENNNLIIDNTTTDITLPAFLKRPASIPSDLAATTTHKINLHKLITPQNIIIDKKTYNSNKSKRRARSMNRSTSYARTSAFFHRSTSRSPTGESFSTCRLSLCDSPISNSDYTTGLRLNEFNHGEIMNNHCIPRVQFVINEQTALPLEINLAGGINTRPLISCCTTEKNKRHKNDHHPYNVGYKKPPPACSYQKHFKTGTLKTCTSFQGFIHLQETNNLNNNSTNNWYRRHICWCTSLLAPRPKRIIESSQLNLNSVSNSLDGKANNDLNYLAEHYVVPHIHTQHAIHPLDIQDMSLLEWSNMGAHLLRRIKIFSTYNVLKKAALSVIAQQMGDTSPIVAPIRNLFLAFDLRGTGCIPIDELAGCLVRCSRLNRLVNECIYQQHHLVPSLSALTVNEENANCPSSSSGEQTSQTASTWTSSPAPPSDRFDSSLCVPLSSATQPPPHVVASPRHTTTYGNGEKHLNCSSIQDSTSTSELKMDESVADLIRDHLDLDGSGAIEYTEFLAGSIDPRLDLKEGICRAAFHVFDRDCDGHIGPGEMKQMLGWVENIAPVTEINTCECNSEKQPILLKQKSSRGLISRLFYYKRDPITGNTCTTVYVVNTSSPRDKTFGGYNENPAQTNYQIITTAPHDINSGSPLARMDGPSQLVVIDYQAEMIPAPAEQDRFSGAAEELLLDALFYSSWSLVGKYDYQTETRSNISENWLNSDSEPSVSDLMMACDLDCDGRIGFEDFVNLIMHEDEESARMIDSLEKIMSEDSESVVQSQAETSFNRDDIVFFNNSGLDTRLSSSYE